MLVIPSDVSFLEEQRKDHSREHGDVWGDGFNNICRGDGSQVYHLLEKIDEMEASIILCDYLHTSISPSPALVLLPGTFISKLNGFPFFVSFLKCKIFIVTRTECVRVRQLPKWNYNVWYLRKGKISTKIFSYFAAFNLVICFIPFSVYLLNCVNVDKKMYTSVRRI